MAHFHGRWRLRRRAPSPHGLYNCPGHSCGAIGVCAVSNAIKPFPVTHQHIFNVIRTYLDESDGLAEGRPLRVLDESDGLAEGRPLRVLDIGCGDGRMMHSLHALAKQHWPGRAVEVHGFDIGEHGFKDDGQMAAAIDLLTASHPGVDWK